MSRSWLVRLANCARSCFRQLAFMPFVSIRSFPVVRLWNALIHLPASKFFLQADRALGELFFLRESVLQQCSLLLKSQHFEKNRISSQPWPVSSFDRRSRPAHALFFHREKISVCREGLQSRNVIAQLPGGRFDQRTCAASGSTSGMTLGMRMVESGMAHPRWRRKAIM